jgi:hypothetical protein
MTPGLCRTPRQRCRRHHVEIAGRTSIISSLFYSGEHSRRIDFARRLLAPQMTRCRRPDAKYVADTPLFFLNSNDGRETILLLFRFASRLHYSTSFNI